MRKGIILAGGKGSRLAPLTNAISKQLLPIFDKPMIYYPLTTLMLSGIKDILIITTEHDQIFFKRLLGNGNLWGIEISYQIQREPKGLAEAFIIGEKFIGKSNVALILGDNLFHGDNLYSTINKAKEREIGSTIFAYQVKDPERYGIVEFDENGKALSINEKPKIPKSNFAIPGLYFYDNSVVDISKTIKYSDRGELEITSLNKIYLEKRTLNVEIMGRGIAWLDAGTFDSLHEASSYIKTLENRQGTKIACPEEVALKMGFIKISDFEELAYKMPKNDYREYLIKIIDNRKNKFP